MTGSTADQPFERLVHRFAPGATLLRAWELSGGTSARVTALEIEHPAGRMQKLIVRRHGAADLARNPHITMDEFRLLHFLHAAGVPAPTPLHLDESGEIFPTPCLVVEYIEGGPIPLLADVPDLIRQLAAQLAALHQLSGTQRALAFLPEEEQNIARKLRTGPAAADESPDERRIRKTLLTVWPLPAVPTPPVLRKVPTSLDAGTAMHAAGVSVPRRNPSALLHGDFWPGNTLWRDGRLVAVIDWEDAALGDPLADLARSRLEVLWAYGGDAMQSFTQHYQALNPLDCTDLPYWELCAALRQISTIAGWGLDAATERTMRAGLRLFIDQAFEKLPAAVRPPC